MNRADTFAFRISNNERQLIAILATHLQRSQSDAVRFVVIEAARQLSQPSNPSPGTNHVPEDVSHIPQPN